MSLHQRMQHLARQKLEQLGSPTLAHSYIPLLTRFTQEDRDAKGLRTFTDGQDRQPPIHLAALELVRDYRLLLLQGPPGSGKSLFARHLALCASGALIDDPSFNPDLLRRLESRNEQSDRRELAWNALPMALYHVARDLQAIMEDNQQLARHWLDAGQPLLLIIDDVQLLDDPRQLLVQTSELSERYPTLHVLLLGDSDLCGEWSLPAAWQRHTLLPLLASQRRAWLATQRYELLHDHWLADWAGHPATFALALTVDEAHSEFDLARRVQERPMDDSLYNQQLLQAAGLVERSPAQIARWLASQPVQAQRPVTLYARALHAPGELFDALLQHREVPVCVLLAAELAGAGHAGLQDALLNLIEKPGATLHQRVAAGQALARLGDPRDLLALCAIPAGELCMGTAEYATARPAHRLSVAAFSMGRYPVSNGVYQQFIQATGREWRSVEGRLPERRNAPAVDLTWHDAQAFCAWLTLEWQGEGRIRHDQQVRLPTEPEWEYAARGTQDQSGLSYPWQGPWQADHCNGEEASLNDTCTVGLFPLGRTPWGCDDLCSTLR